MAAEIDGENVDLIEQFAEVAKGWKGLLPRTRLEMEKAAVEMFIEAIREDDGKASLFKSVRGQVEDYAYRVAAIGAFQILEMIVEHERPEFLRACLAVAIGIEPRSQVEIAEEFGVERATVSKWARRFVEEFGLAPGRGMRRPAAVEAYRKRARGVWEGRKAA